MSSILVADDNTNIQKMVALAFEQRGIKVVAVGNGEAAVRRIPELKPDLVLADVFMPVRSGYEVCEFVKKDGRFAHVPVILLVGAFDPLDEKEARRVGADGVLKKPFVPPDPLIAMVTAALERNPKVAAESAKQRIPAPASQPAPVFESSAKPGTYAGSEPAAPSPDSMSRGYESSTRESILEGGPQEKEGAPEVAGEQAAKEPEKDVEDFDGASTSNDWRRTAMNFEVPADVANQLPFDTETGFEESMFPSEAKEQPADVRSPERTPAEASAVQDHAQASPTPVSEGPAEAAPKRQEPISSQAAKPAERTPELGRFPAVPAPSPFEPEVAQGQPGAMANHASLGSIFAQHGIGAPTAEVAVPSVPPDWAVQADADVNAEASPAEVEPSSSHARVDAEESFFAEDPVAEKPLAAVSPAQPVPSDIPPAPAASTTSFKAPQFESEPEVAALPETLREPQLIEPSGVRVTPESMLVQEDSETPSNYGGSDVEIPPVYSFVPPPSAEESSPSASEAAGEVAASTAPSEGSLDAPSPETVNAVVQKVLEKLEPQLHEILAQGVLRPLVENLLQAELAKKH